MSRKNNITIALDKAIGSKIHELRISRGLSREQLGDQIDVTHQQLQKYEKGANRISSGRLILIARALKVPVLYFFEDLENFVPSENNHERLGIELARVFLNIKDEKQQQALVSLARTLN